LQRKGASKQTTRGKSITETVKADAQEPNNLLLFACLLWFRSRKIRQMFTICQLTML
jgi:hypothetical protein